MLCRRWSLGKVRWDALDCLQLSVSTKQEKEKKSPKFFKLKFISLVYISWGEEIYVGRSKLESNGDKYIRKHMI